MNLLLDSQIIIWIANGHPSLREATRQILRDNADSLFVSMASLWELSIKLGKGPLEMQVGLREVMSSMESRTLEITLDDIECAANLPPHHHDPFDRMLVAQALNRQFFLITSDEKIGHYNVPLIKA